MPRQYSAIDQAIGHFDRALQTLSPGSRSGGRPSPAAQVAEGTPLNDAERSHAAGLMRVNHTGEVCAQALYQGQALTAKLPEVRQEMAQAADEELDHLTWCEQRLDALDSHTSVLNPFWYGMSFAIGATAGLISDKISLGFVAATEDQVCEHLADHMVRLPEQDLASRAVVAQMMAEEQAHGTKALAAGGAVFPKAVKKGMSLASKLMTETVYRF